MSFCKAKKTESICREFRRAVRETLKCIIHGVDLIFFKSSVEIENLERRRRLHKLLNETSAKFLKLLFFDGKLFSSFPVFNLVSCDTKKSSGE